MTETELTTADRIAVLGGGGPIALWIVVLGLINTLADAVYKLVVAPTAEAGIDRADARQVR